LQHHANVYVQAPNHVDALWLATLNADASMVRYLLDDRFDRCRNHRIEKAQGNEIDRHDIARTMGVFPDALLEMLRCRAP